MIIAPEETHTIVSITADAETALEYVPATVYAANATVQVAAAKSVYKSLVDNNTGNTPSASPLSWKRIAATNEYNWTDSIVNVQTVGQEEVKIVLTVDNVNTVGLLNIEGTQAQITMTDSNNVVVRDVVINLLEQNESGFYQYWWSPQTYRKDVTAYFPAGHYGAKLEIIVRNSGKKAKIGIAHPAYGTEIGELLADPAPRFSKRSHTKITTDLDTGNIEVVKGAKAKTNDCWFEIPTPHINMIDRFLDSMIGERVLYIIDDELEPLIVLAILENFEITYENNRFSRLRLYPLKGLI